MCVHLYRSRGTFAKLGSSRRVLIPFLASPANGWVRLGASAGLSMRVNLARWLLDLSVVKGKCSVGYSASIPRKYANGLAQRVEVHVAKVVHPCRVKSFREAVSFAVM